MYRCIIDPNKINLCSNMFYFKYGSKVTWLNFARKNTKLQWQIVGELINIHMWNYSRYVNYYLCVMENKHAKYQSSSTTTF